MAASAAETQSQIVNVDFANGIVELLRLWEQNPSLHDEFIQMLNKEDDDIREEMKELLDVLIEQFSFVISQYEDVYVYDENEIDEVLTVSENEDVGRFIDRLLEILALWAENPSLHIQFMSAIKLESAGSLENLRDLISQIYQNILTKNEGEYSDEESQCSFTPARDLHRHQTSKLPLSHVEDVDDKPKSSNFSPSGPDFRT